MTYLPRWTSPRTFGDPQGAILIMLLAWLALFAHTNAFSSEAADPSTTASSWRARGEALIHQEGGEAAGADFAEGGAS